MKKSELKSATIQELIETLIRNEGTIVENNGIKVKKYIKENNDIAKELDNRGVINAESFIINMEYMID